jgi:molybdate transport system ATP-binding protein
MVPAEAPGMSLELQGVRLLLGPFTLEVDANLAGRVTAVFGASGAGKTTLLELIAGLRRPAAGLIRLDGTPVTDTATRRTVRPEHRGIGYVPQEGALFPHLSVEQNLRFGLASARQPGGESAPGERSAACAHPPGLSFEHVVRVLEIAALTGRPVAALSGGEKQRVALGRALLSAPRLLLLDEPLAGLDAPLRRRLLPYLALIRDEFSIPMLYVTHSPDEVMALADEVLVLHAGKVAGHGAPASFFRASALPHYERKP